jgi:hypothetical protein
LERCGTPELKTKREIFFITDKLKIVLYFYSVSTNSDVIKIFSMKYVRPSQFYKFCSF